ncbi:hypothetical protein IPH92_00275 [Candidatus Kaiserbacteria bacterium]|nr:MAG: hypothetical protein IPH92_00275 [Candidatus Kaiserbacteria bacterium]
MDNALVEYVANRIRAGVTKAEVQEELLAVGWSEEESAHAYKSALVVFGTPVPTEGNRQIFTKKSSTVDVVVNFFSFILLGITATSLGTLFYQVINKFIKDPLDATVHYWYDSSWQTDVIHYAIAALLIAYPLYFFAMHIWFKKFREDEGRSESKLTKWLTYLVLLVAAVTVVGDLITVVYKMLQGEASARFFLKALTILVIAGMIFAFYYLERKKVQYQLDIPRSIFKSLGMFTTGLVTVAIVLGFFAGGSPKTERNRTFDVTRASDLTNLVNCVSSYAITYEVLPATLDDLKNSRDYYCNASMTDPETGTAYTYRIVTPSTIRGTERVGEFELCATFALQSEKANGNSYYYGNSEQWSEHTAGLNCDTMDARIGDAYPMPTGTTGAPTNWNY